jgi:hypothetical protein
MSNTTMARLVEIFEQNIASPNTRFWVNSIIHDSAGNEVVVSDDGQMHVVLEGKVDDNNSTATPLGAGATWTGSASETLAYAVLTVMVYSDKASATDGLTVEFSSDGTNWDSDDVFTIPPLRGKSYSFQPQAKYHRVSYTNGGTIQTEFRLQTILKKTYVKPSSHRVKDDISGDDDAELVKSVITIDSGDNAAYKDINANNPIPTSVDSVYSTDINQTTSTSVDFTGGEVVDLFRDLSTTLTNSTSNNPKTIIINFKKAVIATGLAIGDANGGTHSNIKIEVLRGGNTYTTVNDNSALAVPFNSRFYSFSTTAGLDNVGVVAFTGLRITFNTTNTIAISNIFISKIQDRITTLQGLKPSGTATFIGATNNSNLKVSVQEYGDTPSIDAFARLRTSAPFTIFDSKQLHDKQPLFWDEELGGSATSVHNTVNAEVKMSVTASASDYAIRQTKQRFNYQPGKSQLIFMTFHSPEASGATKRIGCFDGTGVNNLTPNNGVFFETDGIHSWNIAKNGTTTETILQPNWNVDPMDGTGHSGITLDFETSQILIIDYEWLGVGRVRVGFVIDGLIYYCHYFNHANNTGFEAVYMSTPNLPLRYDVQTDGTEATHLDHICSTVMSEGGIEKTGILRSIESSTSLIAGYTTGSDYALLGIRLKSAYLDVTVIPENINIILGSSDTFKWTLELNPTVAGTFTYGDLTNSSIQFATGNTTNTVSARGLVVASGGGSSASRQSETDLKTALRLGATIAGVRDELVLVFTPLSANISQYSTMSIRELL